MTGLELVIVPSSSRHYPSFFRHSAFFHLAELEKRPKKYPIAAEMRPIHASGDRESKSPRTVVHTHTTTTTINFAVKVFIVSLPYYSILFHPTSYFIIEDFVPPT
jgi:hypothetical protein